MQTKELVRQAYLDAMGIQVWFPRHILPNALPARIFEGLKQADIVSPSKLTSGAVPFSEEPSKISTNQRTSHINTSDILKSVGISKAPTNKQPPPEDITKTSDILKSLVISKAPTNKQPPPETITKVTKITPITTFRIVMLSLGHDCLVVAEMPYTGQNTFTHHHYKLLQNIATALALPLPTKEHAKEFVWPLESISAHNSLFSKTDHDEKAASDSVIAYLSKQFFLPERKVILLFGQAAARFVFDLSHSFEELRGINYKKNNKQIFAITHGLNEMMKIPSLKPEVWQDLQPIIHSQPLFK